MTRGVPPPDAVVVGAGSTGAMAALALAERGLAVTVVDERETPGARWIDGVPGWFFDEARIARPVPPERWGDATEEHGFVLVTASGRARIDVAASPALHVDMRHLVARLHREAERAGATFVRGKVTGVIARGGRVEGVEVEGPARRALYASLFVDASGMRGALRKALPSMRAVWPDVARGDICAAAQETFAVRDRRGARAFLASHGARPGQALGILGLEGGFSTLTLFTEPALDEVGVLTGSIPASGAATGARMLERFVASAPWLGASRFGGRGAIPLRRPYAVLGGGGVALVGDAACQVYGAHGSGVGMGLVAARMLADAVSASTDPGSAEALDRYTRRFHVRYGGVLAGADAFRRFSETLRVEELDRLIASGLMDEVLFTSGLDQKPPPPRPAWVAQKIARAIRSPKAAARVLPAVTRVVALQRAAGLLGRARRAGTRRALDRAISAVVG